MTRKYTLRHVALIAPIVLLLGLFVFTLSPAFADVLPYCDDTTAKLVTPKKDSDGNQVPAYCKCVKGNTSLDPTADPQSCSADCKGDKVPTEENGQTVCEDPGQQTDPTVGQPIAPGLGAINLSSLPGAGGNNANTSVLKKVLQIVFGIAGALALLIITIAGFRYVASAGDPQATAGAKNAIVYAIVGLLVAIFAEALVSFVAGNL
jgi:hypothetical protein